MLVWCHRVHAALHHSRHWHQARQAAGDVALQDVNIRSVRLFVPLPRYCLAACVVAHLHEPWILIRWQAIDVMIRLLGFYLDEAGEALLDVVGTWDLLPPVAHIDPQHLQWEVQPCEGEQVIGPGSSCDHQALSTVHSVYRHHGNHRARLDVLHLSAILDDATQLLEDALVTHKEWMLRVHDESTFNIFAFIVWLLYGVVVRLSW